MGVYVLVMLGVTAAVTDATQACAAWPICGSGYDLPQTLIGWIVIVHRVIAALVGGLLLATLGYALSNRLTRRVLLAILTGSVLYPFQAGIGAIVATKGGTDLLSGIHLGGGLSIFLSLTVALAWTLESDTGTRARQKTTHEEVPTSPHNSPTEAESPVGTTETGFRGVIAAYVRLTKPRLMWLLSLVASAGMGLAAATSATLTPEIALATLAGGVLSIGASGTFNHILERDVDRQMQRTSDRPLATDVVSLSNAIVFGTVLSLGSVALFAWVNPLVAVLGLTAIIFYTVVYTLILKPHTVQNTVIGGAAGALPALIGWTAVAGEIGIGGIALAVLIFVWTPAHFYNLALAYQDDYERGGFPMMPVIRGETTTRKHVVWWLALTLAVAGGLATMQALGLLFAMTSIIFGGIFLYFVMQLHYRQSDSAAFRSFHASNAYLGSVLFAILIDSMVI
ncbi:MAG: protoheme IX farnesyltransferase [Haloquadratum sp. J07HQX50]|nr:MAG: protoheme IX farnesyltransferase [Haloquadratum sp. J07HQX50]